MTRAGTPCLFATRENRVRPIGRDDDARLRLAEQQRARRNIAPRAEVDRRAVARAAIHHAALGERDGKTAVAAVVRRRERARR